MKDKRGRVTDLHLYLASPYPQAKRALFKLPRHIIPGDMRFEAPDAPTENDGG